MPLGTKTVRTVSAGPVRWGLGLLLLWVLTVGLLNGALEPGPDRKRFYDERYNLQNVSGILLEEAHRPVNGYYPPLSYLPQTAVLGVSNAVHRGTEWQGWAIHDGRRFTPTAYRLARAFSTAYAVLAVWLLFLLGRDLFDPVTGLVGAFLLAMVPLHIHHSGFFKPDSLLVAACVLAMLLALRAVDAPGLGTWARAGVGVGLATAAKLNGVSTAVPLVLASFAGWRPDRRRLALLGVATGAAILVVLATNPFPALALRDLAHNLEIYEWKAGRQGAPEGGPWRQAIPLLLSANYHGPVVGALALLGLAGLVLLTLRPGTGDLQRKRLLVPLGFFFGYTLLVGATTPFARFTLFLPVAPVTALAAAWFSKTVVDRVAGIRPALGRALGVLLFVLMLTTGIMSHRHLYRWYVPTTWDVAGQLAARSLESPSFRTVCSLGADESLRVKRQGKRSALIHLTAGGGRAPGAVAREAAFCDVSILPLENGLAGDSIPATGRIGVDSRPARYRQGGRSLVLQPEWGRARGPALEVGLHPWRTAGAPVAVELSAPEDPAGSWLGRLGVASDPEVIRSLALRLPAGLEISAPPSLTVAGEPLPLAWMDVLRGGSWYLSPRRSELGRGGVVDLSLGRWSGEGAPELQVLEWLPPADGVGLKRPR